MTDPHIFYVSSFGGSATQWFADTLSMHPQVMCLHGKRNAVLPDGPEGVDADEFIARLVDFSRNRNGDYVAYGAVHGYHGLSAQPSVLKHHGRFSAMIRHPIRRIHSLFWERMRRILPDQPDSSDAMYGLVAAIMATESRFPDTVAGRAVSKVRRLLGDRTERDRILYANLSTQLPSLFRWICRGTLHYDLECCQRLPHANILVTERLVSDRDYLKTTIETSICPSLPVADNYIDRVFSVGKVNQHSRDAADAKSVRAKFPKPLQDILNTEIEALGAAEVRNLYRPFGYEL